jgi:tetratricopeptide (TPR) repeat protein
MINVTRLKKNIWENFKYDCILTEDWKRDRSLFLPSHTEHLIQNYAAAFVQLAYIEHQDSSYADALRAMEVAGQISPNMQPPRQLLGLYYLDAGDTSRAIQYYLDRLRDEPGDVQLMYRLGGVYERMGDFEKALDLIDAIIADDPEDRDLTVTAYSIANKAGLYDRARRYLDGWLNTHPGDGEVQRMLVELDARIRTAPSRGPGQ